MEAVARIITFKVPVINRDVSYLIFSLTVTVFILTLMAVGRMDSASALPIVTLIVGHFFGMADGKKESVGGRRKYDGYRSKDNDNHGV